MRLCIKDGRCVDHKVLPPPFFHLDFCFHFKGGANLLISELDCHFEQCHEGIKRDGETSSLAFSAPLIFPTIFFSIPDGGISLALPGSHNPNLEP